MNKITKVFAIGLVLFGIATSANALQYGLGTSTVDLNSFSYTVDEGNPQTVYARNLGWYSSSGYTLAVDQDEVQSDGFSKTFYNSVTNNWVEVSTSDALAKAGTDQGKNFSMAEAQAGDGHGTYSGALAGTYLSAYQFYVEEGGSITFNINYYIDSKIYGDEPGYALAGAGAILGIYQNGANQDGDGHWLGLADSYSDMEISDEGVLSVTLTGLEAGSVFNVFAGTAAWAAAFASGDNNGNAPVPEPATILLLGTGLVGIAGVGRKKFKK